MNNNIFKNLFKYLLRRFNRKIIKIRRRKPLSFVHDVPNKESVDSIINSKGIIHIGAHRGLEGIVYEWFNKTSKKFQDEEFIKIYLNYPREYIIEKINLRTKNMFKKGVINEVKKFTKLNVKKDKIINKVIGISEIQKYLNDGESLKKIIESISIKTRQYAKRQKTWGKKNMCDWLQIENHKSIKHFKF